VTDLCDWFTLHYSYGPAFGYTPQPSECFVVAAAPFFQCLAGHWFLGNYNIDPFVLQNPSSGAIMLSLLLHLNHKLLLQALQFEWSFLMRVT